MARTTVENCFKKLNNKFELTILTSYRAKEISKGATTAIDSKNDKSSVIALREIEREHLDIPMLKRAYIQSLQTCLPNDDVIDNYNDKNENILNPELKESASISDELIENEFISVDEGDDSEIDALEPNIIERSDLEEDSNLETDNDDEKNIK